MAPTLSVVIPVYNEPRWIGPVVEDLVAAVERSPFEQPELIVVDDGSDAATQAALAKLATPFPLRILHQDNSGRFAARRAGVNAARGEMVLLLDARVSIEPDALAFVASRWHEDEPLPIWNAHVDIDMAKNPFARFWNILSLLAFRDYYDAPCTTSYSLEEFDRYPKGTTCFLAPRTELLAAIASFHSYYRDERNANDDTPVIRALAARQQINISPAFSCLYRSRESLAPFLRHAFHRGGVFVDGYGRPGTRFFGVIAAFYPMSAVTLGLAIRRPRLALTGVALAPLGGAGLGFALRRSRADVAALAMLGPLWLCVFAAGMWRGLWLAMRASAASR
jgi:glycosyltransferase involved in cell wall biosynthesis